MFTQISVHQCYPAQKDTAMEIFRKNSELARTAPGYVSRYVLVALDDPMKVTTATTWKTKEDLEAWRTNPARPRHQPGTPPR